MCCRAIFKSSLSLIRFHFRKALRSKHLKSSLRNLNEKEPTVGLTVGQKPTWKTRRNNTMLFDYSRSHVTFQLVFISTVPRLYVLLTQNKWCVCGGSACTVWQNQNSLLMLWDYGTLINNGLQDVVIFIKATYLQGLDSVPFGRVTWFSTIDCLYQANRPAALIRRFTLNRDKMFHFMVRESSSPTLVCLFIKMKRFWVSKLGFPKYIGPDTSLRTLKGVKIAIIFCQALLAHNGPE